MVRRKREPEPEPEKSRSQKKRDSTALQAMGEELAALGQGGLASLPLSDDLREALAELRSLRSHEARRRQMQYIGRLMREMREIDTEQIRVLLAAMRDAGRHDADRFKRIETWRDRLAAAGESAETEIAEIMDAFPLADPKQLRQLAKAAAEEAAGSKAPHASRKLFRYLRTLDEAAIQAAAQAENQPHDQDDDTADGQD